MISAFVLCACDMYKVVVKVSESICDQRKVQFRDYWQTIAHGPDLSVPVLVSKVILEHGHTYSFCLWLARFNRLSSCDKRLFSLQSQRYLFFGPLQKTFSQLLFY